MNAHHDQPGNVALDTHVADLTITSAERDVLRKLGERVMSLSRRQIEAEKKVLWTRQNQLQPSRPLILCDPEFSWREIIPDTSLQCEHALARHWERRLRKEIFWGEKMGDDRVVESRFTVGWVYRRTFWGPDASSIHPQSTWSDLNDLSGLQFQTITVDRDATTDVVHLAREVFDRVLPVKLREQWYWSLGLTRELIKLRGFEQFMRDIRENPAGVHNLMAFLRDGTLDLITFLEQAGLYSLNNEGDYIGSGGFGWTTQLPAKDYQGTARAKDLWALFESQDTRDLSPELFDEFVLQYQKPVMERFGLVCYGCCEPISERWHLLQNVPNIRRVSVSPTCNRAKMAEALQELYPGIKFGIGP
ncbi:MAG TPA: hypothetical protein PK770_05220, partial [Kiritimatiellia bacterium]|nr:hypothetical protein [Kiritimatiellia bacterium]